MPYDRYTDAPRSSTKAVYHKVGGVGGGGIIYLLSVTVIMQRPRGAVPIARGQQIVASLVTGGSRSLFQKLSRTREK